MPVDYATGGNACWTQRLPAVGACVLVHGLFYGVLVHKPAVFRPGVDAGIGQFDGCVGADLRNECVVIMPYFALFASLPQTNAV